MVVPVALRLSFLIGLVLCVQAAWAQDRFVVLRGQTYRLVPVEDGESLRAQEEARRRAWRRVTAGLAAAAVAATATFGVFAFRAGSRLADPATPQVEIPSLVRSRSLHLAGVGVSLGAAAASLVSWLLLGRGAQAPAALPGKPQASVLITPHGASVAGGVTF